MYTCRLDNNKSHSLRLLLLGVLIQPIRPYCSTYYLILNGIAVDHPALFMLRAVVAKNKGLILKSRRNCAVAFVIGSGYLYILSNHKR